jgi:hypothetical protein
VDVNRKVFIWGQNFNDDYVIVDVELTNTGIPGKTLAGADTVFQDTLHNFYINIQQELNNNYYSYGSNPAPSTSEQPKYNYVWQHYFGGRTGDSLRVFYFYNADDPANSGDQMGSPIVTQKGRLVNTDFVYYTILHASQVPYSNSAQDIDDFLQPKVTYIGTDTKIPNPGAGEDPYGSPNYWAISGGFSDDYKMSGNVYSGTHHGLNNDELGTPDFSNFVAGTTAAAASRNFSSFGPYDFPFGQKLHFVYASGINGIGIKKSKEIGEMWQNGTLQNPPGMPDSILGWLPSNFVFPSGASEMDKRKDRWISMGKDSIMRSAWRAKWNYDHNYQIPQTPPPPDQITITGFGDGIQVQWSDAATENLPNFAGYRVMRKLSDVDTLFYEEVYSSGPEDKAAMHAFKDKVIFGAEYFYYVQSKALIDPNDQNADPTTRGKIIFSSRNFVPNTDWVNPPSPSTDDMSKIRVVPNPYNINDPLLFGFADQRHIDFRNLPPVCTIKVFTENGDLVQTIQHNRPVEKDGHEPWDLLTANQQVIMSGVYIAVFQKPSGEISYQKFVVVR